jgi:hypothetical protein
VTVAGQLLEAFRRGDDSIDARAGARMVGEALVAIIRHLTQRRG